MTRPRFTSLFAAAFAVLLAAPQAEPQARGTAVEREAREHIERDVKQRPELRRRDAEATRGVPPGWCLGRGNPHNTAANCGDQERRQSDDVIRDRRSFERAHAAFHRALEQRCRDRAAERPRDVEWQVRVRAECRAEHDRWHARYDPDWRG